MQNYLNLLRHVKENGTYKDDRTGTGTYSVFGHQTRYNLEEGFPLLTTKKLHLKSIIHELLWFLKGDTNTQYLQENGVRIWNEWADEKGNLGPVYGAQWRSWQGANGQTYDQIKQLVHDLKTNPDSRRLIVSAWNPSVLPDGSEKEPKSYPEKGLQALPPCHCLFQFYVADGKLSCQLYQRSADSFLGVPFNIASYALLTHMLAHVTGLKVGDFVHTLGDAHIYKNHMQQVDEQLARIPGKRPTLKLNPNVKNLFDFSYDDIEIIGYEAAPNIPAKVAI